MGDLPRQKCVNCNADTGRCAEDEFRVWQFGPLCEACYCEGRDQVLEGCGAAADIARLTAERDALRARVAEQSRYLLADEERRKLTGDALSAEADLAAVRTALGGYPDSDLASLAEATMKRCEALEAFVARIRDAQSEHAPVCYACGWAVRTCDTRGTMPDWEIGGCIRASARKLLDAPAAAVAETRDESTLTRAEVQAELTRRGIDVAPAVARVREALARRDDPAAPANAQENT